MRDFIKASENKKFIKLYSRYFYAQDAYPKSATVIRFSMHYSKNATVDPAQEKQEIFLKSINEL